MKLNDQIKAYYKLETQIFNKISKKKNFSNPCNCKETTEFYKIHEGESPELLKFCIKCGGYLEW